PLSSAQMRVYLLYRMAPESLNYNMPQAIPVTFKLEKKRIEKVVRALIARHESLRTSFFTKEGAPVQKIHDAEEVTYEEVKEFGKIERTKMYAVLKDSLSPFNLEKPPLLRVGIAETTQGDNMLLWDMHHIISDGMSVEILEREFHALYKGEKLPPLELRYRDFACWQKGKKTNKELKEQETYWLERFGGELPQLELPLDYRRPEIQQFDGAKLYFYLDEKETALLNESAAENKVTMFMLLAAIYKILLARLSGSEDIIVGTPTAGRRHAALMKIVGMFVNTLPLRNYPAPDKTFIAFLAELKENTLAAFENQDYQFETLVEKLDIPRDTGRNPVFDAFFSLLNIETSGDEKEGIIEDGESVYLEDTVSKFDITLNCSEGRRLRVDFEYCKKLFKQKTIQRIATYFKRIVSGLLLSREMGDTTDTLDTAALSAFLDKQKRIRISEIEILSANEKQQLIYDFNDTAAQYPEDKTIHQLFEEQVLKTPERISIVGKGKPVGSRQYAVGKEKIEDKKSTNGEKTSSIQLTYRELNEKSNRLAHLLKEKGVEPDVIVGIMVEPSVEMIIGILGILKAGGIYLPIDPEYPESRRDYMLKDSSAGILVTTRPLAKTITFKKEIVYLEDPLRESPQIKVEGTKGAYISYTSGTTGRPKGVVIEHHNVVRLMKTDKFQFDFTPGDTWTLFHSFCFDFSVWETYGPLLYGSKLVVISKMEARDTGRFHEILKEQAVTVLNQTPSAFYHLTASALKETHSGLQLRTIIFGGEALSPG
ncbi:MAG: AMP-binding protein, partial [bacterium]|nr:AMP-binding protein [bacterium]